MIFIVFFTRITVEYNRKKAGHESLTHTDVHLIVDSENENVMIVLSLL